MPNDDFARIIKMCISLISCIILKRGLRLYLKVAVEHTADVYINYSPRSGWQGRTPSGRRKGELQIPDEAESIGAVSVKL